MELGKPEENPTIEIVPREIPVPDREKVPAGIPDDDD
jgi:hypothetical protein